MEEFNIDDVPNLSPKVEELLMICLRSEVDAYSQSLRGVRCMLCPFRSFSRLRYLKRHLQHHCAKNMYLADPRSPQRAVVRAYFDYCQAVVPIASEGTRAFDLLHYSASKIREWNSKCPESIIALLKKANRPVLVRVLTHVGPQYWAKVLTEPCIRHSKDIYYTLRFADLLLSTVLTNNGKVSTTVNALYLHFGSTIKTSGLLPRSSDFWNDILQDIISHRVFKAKVRDLKHKAAASGELEVISHDETFKTLFSLIGQDNMSQAANELHALHTFRGFTGCVIGISAQRSTSALCFKKAVGAIFDDYLASCVKFIFSDSPMRIIKAARSVFKSLLAVGEDAVHLPIRLEYC